MNNIYVDEQPESCLDCEFCIRRNYCCILMQKDVREYRDDCPLILLSYRLAEERKKIVQEIKKVLDNKASYSTDADDDWLIQIKESSLYEILDQIERGE